jgi:hypothetical protein
MLTKKNGKLEIGCRPWSIVGFSFQSARRKVDILLYVWWSFVKKGVESAVSITGESTSPKEFDPPTSIYDKI